MAVAARSSPRMSRICPSCEYDLTGLPEPCVCPECGRAIEAGMRSFRVWSKSGRPSVISALVLGIFGMMLTIGSLNSMWTQRVEWQSMFFGGVGVTFLFAAFYEARKFLWVAQGTTNALLISSPEGLGVSENGKLTWHSWARVKRLRYDNSFLGRDWIVTVIGIHPWYLGTLVLCQVTFRYSRRTAAHVRNTLRRHHRAWQKSQTQPACATAVQQ